MTSFPSRRTSLVFFIHQHRRYSQLNNVIMFLRSLRYENRYARKRVLSNGAAIDGGKACTHKYFTIDWSGERNRAEGTQHAAAKTWCESIRVVNNKCCGRRSICSCNYGESWRQIRFFIEQLNSKVECWLNNWCVIQFNFRITTMVVVVRRWWASSNIDSCRSRWLRASAGIIKHSNQIYQTD